MSEFAPLAAAPTSVTSVHPVLPEPSVLRIWLIVPFDGGKMNLMASLGRVAEADSSIV
jgi:hypothetical protein